mgnify:CR=1 FL=1
MTAGLWIVGVLAVLLAALYIRVNQYGAPPVKLLLKTLASLAFVCLGLLGAARAGGAYAWLTWIGLILGAASGISVMLSALMHHASTILVVANSLRLMFFPPMEGR